jgi:hypothetical protein
LTSGGRLTGLRASLEGRGEVVEKGREEGVRCRIGVLEE